MSAQALLATIRRGAELTHLEARFAAKVMPVSDGCLIWVGSRSTAGYGAFHVDGTNRPAHRWLYEYVNGAVPSHLVLDHLCSNRACVNPEHLEPVTRAENTRRGSALDAARAAAAAITHCPFGHPYSAENTYVDKKGARNCRACHRADKTQGPRLQRAGRVREVCR